MVSLLFCFREGFEPTSMRGSGGALPLGGWTPSALYDLPLKGQIGNRIPHPLLWTPHGVSSFLLQRGIRPHPMQGLRRSLANRQLDADCSLRFAPKANRPSNPSSSSTKGLLNNPKRKSQTLSRNGKGLLFLTHQGCG